MPTADDCNDSDDGLGAIADDLDCDGKLNGDDNDADSDAILSERDCDDLDPDSDSQYEDGDCEGIEPNPDHVLKQKSTCEEICAFAYGDADGAGAERCEVQRAHFVADDRNLMLDYAGCVPKCERNQREFTERYLEDTAEAFRCEGIVELTDAG